MAMVLNRALLNERYTEEAARLMQAVAAENDEDAYELVRTVRENLKWLVPLKGFKDVTEVQPVFDWDAPSRGGDNG